MAKGHEMTHGELIEFILFTSSFYTITSFLGFDDEGRQFDSNGNLVDWWQADTAKRFASRAQCIIDQVYESNIILMNGLYENF